MSQVFPSVTMHFDSWYIVKGVQCMKIHMMEDVDWPFPNEEILFDFIEINIIKHIMNFYMTVINVRGN